MCAEVWDAIDCTSVLTSCETSGLTCSIDKKKILLKQSHYFEGL